MNTHKIDNIALSLAGVVQAVYLVNELARYGNANEDAIAVSINSIVKLDSETVSDVYGNVQSLQLGLTALLKLLRNPNQDSLKNMLRYMINLFTLSKRLLASPTTWQMLRKNLENIQRQMNYFPPLHETIIENLSTAYVEMQTSLQLRIIIVGKELYLKTADIQNKIRTLLLAGLRSAVLWRQVGGSRWQLLLQRQKLLEACQRNLNQPFVNTDSLHHS